MDGKGYRYNHRPIYVSKHHHKLLKDLANDEDITLKKYVEKMIVEFTETKEKQLTPCH